MIGIIVAYDRNKNIGKDGKIPWKISGEQKQFKELTTGNIIVMGRKTFEDMNCHPLPNRVNVLISSTMLYNEEKHYFGESGMYIYKSLENFIEDYKVSNSIFGFTKENYNKDFKGKKLYGIGGRRIFEYFLKIADTIYATEIDHNYGGDVPTDVNLSDIESIITSKLVKRIDSISGSALMTPISTSGPLRLNKLTNLSVNFDGAVVLTDSGELIFLQSYQNCSITISGTFKIYGSSGWKPGQGVYLYLNGLELGHKSGSAEPGTTVTRSYTYTGPINSGDIISAYMANSAGEGRTSNLTKGSVSFSCV